MTNSCEPGTLTSPYQSLSLHLKNLHLSHMLNHWQSVEHQAMQEGWSYAQFLLALCDLEVQRRSSLRLQRALTEAQLPTGKRFPTLIFRTAPALILPP